MKAAAEEAAPCTAQEYEALLQFLYMAPVGLAQTDLDGEIALINPLCAQLLMPLSRDGALVNLFDVLQDVAPDLAFQARSFAPAHGKVCDAIQLQVDAGQPGGRDAQVLSLTLLKLDDRRLMAVLDDITQSVRRERELRHSQAWIHTLAHGIPSVDYALIALDRQGLVRGWNEGIRNLTGFEAEETVGQPYLKFCPEDESAARPPSQRLEEADATGWHLEDGWLRRGDGRRFWASCLIAPAAWSCDRPEAERGYSLIVRDISDRREAHEALRRSVWSDHLTGLANRRAFFDAAETALARCAQARRPMAALLLDADRFKAINDAHGHPAGDAVLRHLAAGLRASFGAEDVVARFGGEEFVVLLPGQTLEGAAELAERFRALVAATPVVVAGVPVPCTVSAGVAALWPGEGSVDALLGRADMAMYAAKREGRNRVLTWHAELVTPDAATRRNAMP